MVMCSREVTQGTPVFTEDGTRLGDSPAAAKKAISQVLMSRNVMAIPGMCESSAGHVTSVFYIQALLCDVVFVLSHGDRGHCQVAGACID